MEWLAASHSQHHVFLAIDTNAEARAGGGVVGNYGLIAAISGRFSLIRFGRDSNLNAGGNVGHRVLAGLPAYRTLYAYLQPQVYWQNVLAAPDFPMDAQAIASLYPQSGGVPVNGVIAVDPFGLADLLQIVGPVKASSWPVPITATNAPSILLSQEYASFALPDRVDFLGKVASAVWGRLTSIHLSGLSTIAHALAAAVQQKHLMIWSKDPKTEKALEELGAAGVMHRNAGSDFLAVENINAGGNKLDYYLRRSYSYAVHLDASGNLTGTVTIHLQNLAPAHGLVPYVGGSVAFPNAPSGTNTTDVSIYTPSAVTSATIDGQPALLSPEQFLGLNVYTAQVTLPPGGTGTVVAHLSGNLPLHGHYHLQLFRQATVAPDNVNVQVTLPRSWHVTSTSTGWSGKGHAASSGTFSFDADQNLSLAYAHS